MAVIQRIRCDEKDDANNNNNNNNANNGKCKVARENRSGVGYTRKESILRFVMTKDLKLLDKANLIVNYAALKSEKHLTVMIQMKEPMMDNVNPDNIFNRNLFKIKYIC